VVAGDLPVGAGLSSSAALELATLHAAALLWDLELPAMELCLLAQAVEHRVLGVRSGLLDQLACALSREGHLLLLDFRGPTFRLLPARLQGHAWLVVDSGVRRALGDTGYGRRVEECTEVLNTLREADPRIRTLGDASWELLPRVESRIGPTHAARLRHVLSENARVEAFARAFTLGDARAMGDLLLASHVSLRDDYASSCPALDRLVALAVADPACLGARVMGGGFGGCALLLVEEPALEAFEPRLLASYQQSVGIAPRAFRFELGGGARGFRARRA
jgi:galactokinase